MGLMGWGSGIGMGLRWNPELFQPGMGLGSEAGAAPAPSPTIPTLPTFPLCSPPKKSQNPGVFGVGISPKAPPIPWDPFPCSSLGYSIKKPEFSAGKLPENAHFPRPGPFSFLWNRNFPFSLVFRELSRASAATPSIKSSDLIDIPNIPAAKTSQKADFLIFFPSPISLQIQPSREIFPAPNPRESINPWKKSPIRHSRAFSKRFPDRGSSWSRRSRMEFAARIRGLVSFQSH